MSYKRILLSVSMIAFVGALVVGATGAFFSDTETSTGNTFTAGAIDLQVANTSYFTNANGELEQSTTTTFTELGDDGQLFFDFADLKPGDIGEDTITINVDSNDAWACMANDITATPENDVTEPESESNNEDDAQTDQMLDDGGELQEQLMFAVWHDDGDNVYEDDERLLNLGSGTSSFVTAEELANEGVQTLADSEYSLFTENNDGEPLDGGEDYHIGKAWCLGDMSEGPVGQDGSTTTNPVDRGTGFNCSGQSVDNSTQTDGIESALQFYAVQSRNNDEFTCEGDFSPDFGGDESAITVETDTGWSPEALSDSVLGESRWVGKARLGNQDDLGQTYELEVGFGSAGNRAEEDHAYTDATSESFTLEYEESNNEATLTVGNDSVTYTVDGPATSIGITAKGGANGTTKLENIDINGNSISDLVSTTDDHMHASISGSGISGDFTVTGDLTLDWNDPTTNELPTLQVDVLY